MSEPTTDTPGAKEKARDTKVSTNPNVSKSNSQPSHEELLDASAAEIERNPNFLMALIERAKNNPTLAVMAKQNTHSAKMAVKAKAGKLLLTRIRNNIIRPSLPEQYQGVLDSPLVCGMVDLAIGNMLLFAGVQFQDKLPAKIRPYATVMGEAATYSAYNDTLGGLNIEAFFTKLVSGDVFDMFKELVNETPAE